MTLDDVQFIFNRALSKTFDKKKLLLVFLVLALCGILVVFFRGLAVNAGQWLLMSLSFLPVFLCAGVLLSTGILIIRIYHDEIKHKEIKYADVLAKSWDVILGASYFAIPLILSYLVLWMLLGIFFLFKQIPGVGDFFGAILAFGPFLVNLGSLVLCLLSFSMLFFVSPVIALRGFNRIDVSQTLVNRFKNDVFSNLFLAIISILPLLFVLGLLVLSAFLTGAVCTTCDQPIYTVVQWFFVMIPFTAVLAPAVVFFFNFAAESHVLIRKELANR